MFVSYAQNFEDVILWRALKHVEKGFYIDIGAQDPKVDSVSCAFYERGWRGLHIEPATAYATALRRERPDELVIEAVVGEEAGEVTLFEIAGTGLSTADRSIAAGQMAAGRSVQAVRAMSVRLSDVLENHKDREIHWLKIDVEGTEKSVIRSWKASTVRPWIIVVEYVDPISQEDVSAKWEPELCSLGYEFVYTDGLNKFYLSEAHRELRSHFGAGPNVFDGFTLSGTQSAPFSIHLNERIRLFAARETELAARLVEQTTALETARQEYSSREGELASRLADANREVARLHQVVHEQNEWGRASVRHVENLTDQLTAIRQSTSWRVTQPFRSVSELIRSAARLARRLPVAVVRRGTGLVHRKALRLYGRIAVNRPARRVYSVFMRPRPGAPAARSDAPDSFVAAAATGSALVSQPSTGQSAGIEVNRTLVSLTSAMRNWTLGGRLDARS
jgi:FkbM family methyltransferase